MADDDGGTATATRVAALAREELELVEAGRTDELAALHTRRSAAMAQLPARLSPPARDALADALEIQRQVTVALTTGMAVAGAELGRLSHGRTAMAGYAPAGLDARPVLDQSA